MRMKSSFKNDIVRYRNMAILFFIAVVAASVILFRDTLQEPVYLEAQEDALYLKSSTGDTMTIPYRQICSVTLTERFLEGTALSSTANPRVHSGHWENAFLGQYTLFAVSGIDTYLIITTTKENPVVFNYESRETTVQIYSALQALIEKKGLEDQVAFHNDIQ